MALRTGQEYIEGLRDPREVWIGSEPVADVTTHPNFKNSVRTFAGLYDLQHQPDLQPALSYPET